MTDCRCKDLPRGHAGSIEHPCRYEIYYVKGMTERDNHYGTIDHAKNEILLDLDSKPQRKQQTLVHELVHAALSECSIKLDEETEERVCHAVSLFVPPALEVLWSIGGKPLSVPTIAPEDPVDA